jgi:threonine dehydratase
MAHSIDADEILDIESEPTLSDGTAGGIEKGAITFELCKQLIDRFELISENEIIMNLNNFIDNHRMLIEGAASVAISGFLATKRKYAGKKAVIVICGGNISRDSLKEII